MTEKAKRIELYPRHLAWLAQTLKCQDDSEIEPNFKFLLENMPSGLYKYPANEEIIAEGETSTEIYIVYSGELSVWRKKGYAVSLELGRLSVGDFFGEIGFLMKSPRTATVKTVTECQLFKFKAQEFMDLMKQHKSLADYAKKTARNRIQKIFLSQL